MQPGRRARPRVRQVCQPRQRRQPPGEREVLGHLTQLEGLGLTLGLQGGGRGAIAGLWVEGGSGPGAAVSPEPYPVGAGPSHSKSRPLLTSGGGYLITCMAAARDPELPPDRLMSRALDLKPAFVRACGTVKVWAFEYGCLGIERMP